VPPKRAAKKANSTAESVQSKVKVSAKRVADKTEI